MKKGILILAILCMMMVAPAYAVVGNDQGKQPSITDVGPGNQGKVSIKIVDEKVTGLENAQIRLRNETTAQHLNQVMERVRENQRKRFQNMSGLEVTEEDGGKFVAEGKKEAKFLGIWPVQKTYKYEIQEDGNVTYSKGQFDFLFELEQ